MKPNKKLAKRIMPLILGIGIPASLRSISQYIQQIIDTMYLGQYSSEDLLAISSIIIPFWMFESLWIGIMTATTILIAQHIGAKKHAEASKTAQSTFLIAGISGMIYFIFWQNMGDTITSVMNLQGTIAKNGASYITTLSWIYLVRFIGIGAPSSILEALGNTRIIMWATLAQCITNIILDPIFIWGMGPIPEMGIQGAALATVIAEISAVIVLSTYFWRHNYLKIKTIAFTPIKWNIINRIKLGIPITTEVMMWSFATSLIISMLNQNLAFGGAIFNVGFLLSDMCYRMLYGFDVANMSLVGRSFGAKRHDRIQSTLHSMTKVKWLFGLLIVIILYIGKEPLVRMFSNDPVIIDSTLENFIWILAVSLITLSVGINMSTLNGLGYSRFNLYISIIGISLRVLLSAWVIFHTNLGIAGVWGATVVEESLRLVLGYMIRSHLVKKLSVLWKQ
ncbi:MAG: MATE family efflux transporter [Brevinemataceae bacterium]